MSSSRSFIIIRFDLLKNDKIGCKSRLRHRCSIQTLSNPELKSGQVNELNLHRRLAEMADAVALKEVSDGGSTVLSYRFGSCSVL